MKKTNVKPQDYINEYQKEVDKYNDILRNCVDEKELARKWFWKQVNWIQAIKDTEWYKEIKNYFTRILIADQDIIMNSTALWGDKFAEQAYNAAVEMKLAAKFLNFLSNLESEKGYSDDATIEG